MPKTPSPSAKKSPLKSDNKPKRGPIQKFKDGQELGARGALLEDLFYDFYENRRTIYWINFIRGICFGFGSIVGGTVVVLLFIWILGKFVDFPGIGDEINTLLESLKSIRR